MDIKCIFGRNDAFTAGDHINLWTALQVSFFKFFSCVKRLQMQAKHNFEARSLFSYSSCRHTQTIKYASLNMLNTKERWQICIYFFIIF